VTTHWRAAIRWLTPGMRVKRWILGALLSMGFVAAALLYLLGTDLVRLMYRLLPDAGAARFGLATAAAGLGVFGFFFSLFRLMRSVAGGVAPHSRTRASAMIYRTRRLDRGPRVVAIGGGTGLSTLLRGLKEVTSNLSAVVTVMDDGGSSGRLREEIDVLPPGDVRNCLLALADDETRLSDFLQHRFVAPEELAGHSLGNLLIAGLEQATGGFDRAIEAMSHFLNVRGRVLPATLCRTNLVATMEDGTRVTGETRLAADPRRIVKLELTTSPVPPYEVVLEAIAEADLILLGPGSLFTSLIPNLLVDGIAEALEEAPAEKLLISNLMTQPGETQGFTLVDHLRTLRDYIDLRRFDSVLINASEADRRLLEGYIDEDAQPVADDLGEPNEFGLVAHRADLIGVAPWAGKQTIKHDPKKLAKALSLVSETLRSRRERGSTL